MTASRRPQHHAAHHLARSDPRHGRSARLLPDVEAGQIAPAPYPAGRRAGAKSPERVGAGGPPPSSDTPNTAQHAGTTQLAEWPIGGTDEPSHELDHLICEIDEVFGFTRADPPSAPSVASRMESNRAGSA